MKELCSACQQYSSWEMLPDPNKLPQSMRTDGNIVSTSFSKYQCMNCGLVQSKHVTNPEAIKSLYEASYDFYGHKPEESHFDHKRKADIAKAILNTVTPAIPDRILEVGAGHGGMLEMFKHSLPEAYVCGIEPSVHAVNLAKQYRHNVIQGSIGEPLPEAVSKTPYDLIYSVNVIEHTTQPLEFIKTLVTLLSENGKLVTICPNGMHVNYELVFIDHLYSFTPSHIRALYEQAGLVFEHFGTYPERPDDFSLVVASKKSNASTTPKKNILPEKDIKTLLKKRSGYLKAWNHLEQELIRRTKKFSGLYCFGAGEWANLLAVFAPQIWNDIKACFIDGGSSETFRGKPILDIKEFTPDARQAVIIATNPLSSHILSERLQKNGIKAIQWNDIIAS